MIGGPPSQIGEQPIGDLLTAVEAHLPVMLEQFADLFGRNIS